MANDMKQKDPGVVLPHLAGGRDPRAIGPARRNLRPEACAPKDSRSSFASGTPHGGRCPPSLSRKELDT